MNLRQHRFTYYAYGPFTKNKEQTWKFEETRVSRYTYQNELDKASFKLTWPMEILRICPKQQMLIKYYMINHLILLKILNIMYINVELLYWFIYFLINSLEVVVLKWKYVEPKIIWRIEHTNHWKILKTKSTSIFNIQYLGCWSCEYVITK